VNADPVGGGKGAWHRYRAISASRSTAREKTVGDDDVRGVGVADGTEPARSVTSALPRLTATDRLPTLPIDRSVG
jgi:hypothetical protein